MQIKRLTEVISGILSWEAKVAIVKQRFQADLGSRILLAILVGMLPADFQQMVLQNPTVCKSGVYESVRDYVINVAQQRSQLLKPSPMDVGILDSGLNLCGSYSGGCWGKWLPGVLRARGE